MWRLSVDGIKMVRSRLLWALLLPQTCGMILTTTKTSIKHWQNTSGLNRRVRKTLGNWVGWKKKKKRKELGGDLHPWEGAVKKERFPHTPRAEAQPSEVRIWETAWGATVWCATTKGVQQEAWSARLFMGSQRVAHRLSDWTTTDGYLDCFQVGYYE